MPSRTWTKRRYCFLGVSLLLSLVLIGCMSTRSAQRQQTAVPFEKSQFNARSIAVLPSSEGTVSGMPATESTRNLRLATNEALDHKVKELLPTARITGGKLSATTLNESNKLDLLEKLFKTYEVTGTYDDNTVDALCDALNADYLVVSKLTAGKTDAILAKAATVTLEVSIVSKQKKEIVWGGSGVYRKGGVMGFGGVDDKYVAEELVSLVFSKFE